MSHDRIWINSREQSGRWHERNEYLVDGAGAEFSRVADRLYQQGLFVMLVSGKNHCFDSPFVCEDDAVAQEFWSRGFLEWESFICDNAGGCRFDEVSLYGAGKCIATKSSAFYKKNEVEHEQLDRY